MPLHRAKKPKKRADTLADFFAKSPLRGSGLVVRRKRCLPRAMNFDDPPEGGDHKSGSVRRPASKT